jgi:hypothetical protein
MEIGSKTFDGKKQGVSHKVVPDSDLDGRHIAIQSVIGNRKVIETR